MRKARSALKEKRLISDELTTKTGVLHQVHHRHPRSRRRSYRGNINEDRNLAVVPANKHAAWHMITNGNGLPKEWVRELNENYMPPDWYLIAVPRVKSTPKKRRSRRYCKECECEVLTSLPAKCHHPS